MNIIRVIVDGKEGWKVGRDGKVYMGEDGYMKARAELKKSEQPVRTIVSDKVRDSK